VVRIPPPQQTTHPRTLAPVPKPNPKAILAPKDYRTYRNVLIATAWFIFVGGGWAILGPINIFSSKQPAGDLPRWFFIIPTILGLAAVIGGIGIGRGNRALSGVLYVVSCISLIIIPVGTIPGLVVILGFKKYFVCLHQIKAAAADVTCTTDGMTDGRTR